jgi:hypothetical protein
MSFTIRVGYDQESEAYFVKSSDVPGLNVASDRADDLIAIVQDVVPSLLGQKGAGAELTFEFDTAAAREAKLLIDPWYLRRSGRAFAFRTSPEARLTVLPKRQENSGECESDCGARQPYVAPLSRIHGSNSSAFPWAACQFMRSSSSDPE